MAKFLDNKLDGERINIAEKSLREFTIKKAKKKSFFYAGSDLDCLVLQQKTGFKVFSIDVDKEL